MKKKMFFSITLCLTVIATLFLGTDISAFATDDAPQWVGPDDVEIHYGDVTNYVSKDGTYSAEMPADGIAWIYYSNSFDGFWIGIDNPDGIFEEGSRFHVRWSADDSVRLCLASHRCGRRHSDREKNSRCEAFKNDR